MIWRKLNLSRFFPFFIVFLFITLFYANIAQALRSSPEDFLPLETKSFFYLENKKDINLFPFLKGKVEIKEDKKFSFWENFHDLGWASLPEGEILFTKENLERPPGFKPSLSENWFEKESKEEKAFALYVESFWFFSEKESLLAKVELVKRKEDLPLKKDTNFRKVRENNFRVDNFFYQKSPDEFPLKKIIPSFGFSFKAKRMTFFVPLPQFSSPKNISEFVKFNFDSYKVFSVQTRNIEEVFDSLLSLVKKENKNMYLEFFKYKNLFLKEKVGDLESLSSKSADLFFLKRSFLMNLYGKISQEECFDILSSSFFYEKEISDNLLKIKKPKVELDKEKNEARIRGKNLGEISATFDKDVCHIKSKKYRKKESDFEKEKSSAFLKIFASPEKIKKQFPYPSNEALLKNLLSFLPEKDFILRTFLTGKGISGHIYFLD